MQYDAARALELLRQGSGRADARFRDGQEEAIRHVVEGRGRLLVVQATGWGKSFVYFIATRLLREGGTGPALLISPLLALMRNQIEAAHRMGVRAEMINSDNSDAWSEIEARIAGDAVDILLVSPERLANERFRSRVLAPIGARLALVVVDEAHCISDWGHDFRPHYRLLERIIAALPANLRLLATTATANRRVRDDLATVLGPHLALMCGNLDRPSLTLQTIRLPDQAERLAWLAGQLATIDGHGIIYVLTVRDAHLVADWLASRGLRVEAYTGQSGEARPGLEQDLTHNRLKALVATTALGMGYDKPDLSFVFHYQMPGSVVAYYQQVGRAGRALERAHGVLLSGREEDRINAWFIDHAFPSREEVQLILGAIESAPEGLSLGELHGRVNMGTGRIEHTIDILSLESPSPIARSGKNWQLTTVPLDQTFWNRVDRLTALRRAELAQMRDYVDRPFGTHMPALMEALDNAAGTVGRPAAPPLSDTVDPALVDAAIEFLQRSDQPIAPRLQWPKRGLPIHGCDGRIPPEHRARPGRALSIWGNAGWGRQVGTGKYGDGRFADTLVTGCVDLLQRWVPVPAPEWVSCVPSTRHPLLVPDFARRLAKALDLPFRPVLETTGERPEQKTMHNSVNQGRNIDGAFRLSGPVPSGPVLLIDDMVDSRWTLTICAWLLRKAGSGDVWPLALADSSRGA